MLSKKFPSQDEVEAVVIVITVIGFLALAVIDETRRPQFLDLTKFAALHIRWAVNSSVKVKR